MDGGPQPVHSEVGGTFPLWRTMTEAPEFLEGIRVFNEARKPAPESKSQPSL